MARRIGLAQALINDPALVVLDEPTAGLDPIGCRQVKDLMLALSKRGKTVLLSSHLLADVEDVCDRIAILFDGRIRAQGGVEELLESRDRVRLTFPTLAPEELNNVLALIRDRIGREPELDHPSLNLEQFFLEVVEEAHRSASGAGRNSSVAEYLTR
jgi:ABC-2 type transport system ATP-binding protein